MILDGQGTVFARVRNEVLAFLLHFPSLFFAASLYTSLLFFLFFPFPPSSPPFLPTVTARRLLFITSLVRCW